MKLDDILRGSYQRYIARDFLSAHFFDKRIALVVDGIDSAKTLSAVKAKLLDSYGDVPVTVECDGKERATSVSKLGGEADTLVIEGCPLTECKRFGYSDFDELMRRLRADDGCEWDRAQTHESIRINLIEEAYELVDAIDSRDADNIREECGDVLMQAVFHTLIAEKEGEFDSYDMLTELCRKLIDRHTHIFGNNHANNPDEALAFWNEAKKKEKKYASTADSMDRVPKNLPALLYAEKLQKRARKSGFDWDDVSGALEKIAEETRELEDADDAHRAEEGGDLLFAVVNALRLYGIEPEMALKEASAKFLRRFTRLEQLVGETGKPMTEYSLDELDAFWEKVKQEERA